MNEQGVNSVLDRIRDFYSGRLYPAVVCALVLFGSLTGLEMYSNFLTTALFVAAFFICDSTKPIVVSLCTYIFQLSVQNSPSLINNSDYLYTGWRLWAVILSAASIFVGAFYFFFRRRLYKKMSPLRDGLLIPIIVLSAALLLNGAFSREWEPMSLLFAVAQVLVFGLVFFLFYYGLPDGESHESLMSYLSYVASLMAWVIIIQLGVLFLSSDNIFVDGSINKEGVVLGWGIWNLVGACLAMLIPIVFYGAMTSKHSWAYFITATASWIFSVLTMSRNALIFSSLAFAACCVIACFFGRYKRAYRIITCAGILGVAVFAIVFWGRLEALLSDYFERGFDSNGRFELWGIAIKNFLDCPIFGRGFFGFEKVHQLESGAFAHMGPMPTMAHNTPLELLSATGIVGTLAYLYYRVKSLLPAFRRPTLAKTMLTLSVAVTLLGSLLDNFVFNIYPMFFTMVALAMLHRADNQ